MTASGYRKNATLTVPAVEPPGEQPVESSTSAPGRRTGRWALLVLALGILSIVIFYLSTPHGGLGIDPDSLHYLSTAEHLQVGEGFLRYDDELYLFWPPLYPLVIAAVDQLTTALNVDLIQGLRALHALTYGLITVASGALLFLSLRSRTLALLATSAVALAFPLLRISVLLWSESLFALLIVLAMLALRRVLAKPSWASVALLALLLGLVWLQRYIGIMIAGGVGLTLLLWLRVSFGRKLLYLVEIGVILAALNAPWYLRNLEVSGTLTGPRQPTEVSVDESLFDNLQAMQEWLAPPFDFMENGLATTLAAAVIFAALLVLAWHQAQGATPSVGFAAGIVVLVYMGTLFFTSRLTNHSLGQRIVAPVYPLVIALVFAALEQTAGWLGARLRHPRVGLALVAILAAAWLLYPATRMRQEIESFAWCCDYDDWRDSRLVRWLRANPLDGPIYSNTPYPLLAGLDARLLPDELDNIERLTQERGKPIYLAIFDERYRDACPPNDRYCYNTDFDVADIPTALAVEVLIEVSDGRVYALSNPGE